MLFCYNGILRLLTLLASPGLLLILPFSRKWRRRFPERLGYIPKKTRDAFQVMPRPRVWFHAASVGEVAALAPIANAFKARNPNMGMVISTNTVSGLEAAAKKAPASSVLMLMPLDYPRVIRRTVRMVEPNLLVITETELWPNLVRQAKKLGSQLALINGRMSEKSFRGYRWLVRIVRPMLAAFDLLVVQSEKDADRFRNLGANPQRIKIMANAKFDAAVSGPGVDTLRRELRLPASRRVWIAGSTRPGEEEIVLDAFSRVQMNVPDAVLVLAPRHLERLREIEHLLSRRRLVFTRRSSIAKELLDFPLILLDTMGELAQLYGLASVAFVGGSLAPFGGHNPLEPAAQGVPVLVGPHMENFAKTTEILLHHGGAGVVHSAEELAQTVSDWLLHPEECRRRGEAARRAVQAYRGAAGQTVDLLHKLMLIKRWAREVRRWREESLQNSTVSSKHDTMSDDWTVL